MDSIFINVPIFGGHYLINSKGEILLKSQNAGVFRAGRPALNFDQASFFSKNEIDVSLTPSYNAQPNGFLMTRGSINFDTEEVQYSAIQSDAFIPYFDQEMKLRQIATKNGEILFQIPRNYLRDSLYLYASTAISDSIYVFNGDQLKNKIYTGLPDVQIADYRSYLEINSVEHFKNGMSFLTKAKQPAYYLKTVISPDKKVLYRILLHGTIPKWSQELEKDIPQPIGATLTAIELNNQKATYFGLPHDQLALDPIAAEQIFASSDGLHIFLKDQSDESKADFQVFGFEKVSEEELTQ